jgi:hypothetical protein
MMGIGRAFLFLFVGLDPIPIFEILNENRAVQFSLNFIKIEEQDGYYKNRLQNIPSPYPTISPQSSQRARSKIKILF